MNETKPVKFTFVHAKSPKEAKGWWLKISDMDTLTAYVMKTQGNPRIEKAFALYSKLHQKGQESRPAKSVREVLEDLPAAERIKLMTESSSVFNTMLAAIMQAENVNGTILDGFRCLNMETGTTYISHIKEYGVCFINKNGGCNAIIEYDDWCRKDDLVWPDFKEKDIRLKQYPDGNHWYAFIGSMEVHNGDTLRFNTKEKARAAAMNIINNA